MTTLYEAILTFCSLIFTYIVLENNIIYTYELSIAHVIALSCSLRKHSS